MSGIRQQLLDLFAADEPDYGRAAELGAAALPVLREMLDEDPDLAARAVYTAGVMALPPSLEVIAAAARSHQADLRTDAAGAVRAFATRSTSPEDLESAFDVLAPLLEDQDPTVRRFAQRAAAAFPDGAHHHAGRASPS